MATITQVEQVVLQGISRALATADEIGLREEVRKFAASRGLIGDAHQYRRLRLTAAEKAWAAVLFVDMRGSTARAKRLGPRDTFVTMHALLPAMAFLATDYGGYIVGYRGDGLFAAFGIDEYAKNDSIDSSDCVFKATRCGRAMTEAMDTVVNPILRAFRISGDVAVGVGVDVGEIVVTRIGIEGAHEVTVYGDAVNMASKLCAVASGYVLLSPAAGELYPRNREGMATINMVSADPQGYCVDCPVPELAE